MNANMSRIRGTRGFVATGSGHLLDRLLQAVRKRGLLGTIRAAALFAAEPLAPYRPSRLRKRFADRRFDRRHGVDTSSTVDLNRLHLAPQQVRSGTRYEASMERAFRDQLAALPINHEDFVFIDFGSGKGKCLLMASDYPFQKIIGVEFSSELVEVAEDNLKRYRSPRQLCRKLETVAIDATAFDLPPEPGVYYFYNPFDATVMSVMRDNIRQSLNRYPRQIFIVYHNAVHRKIFDECSWLRLVTESDHLDHSCLYRNDLGLGP